MNNNKFRLIYIRYLVLMLGLLAFYSLLHWLLVLKFQCFLPTVFLSHWVGPIVLSVILVLLFLYKRINLLDLQNKKDNDFRGYVFSAVLFTAGPIVAFQYFLVDVTGELRILNTPEEIVLHKPARYYIIKNHKADKHHNRRENFRTRIGKGKGQTAHDLIIAVPLYAPDRVPEPPVKIGVRKDTPVFAPPGDTITLDAPVDATAIFDEEIIDPVTAPIWLCRQYETTINNGLLSSERDFRFQVFRRNSIVRFQMEDLDGFTYLRRPDNNPDFKKFAATVGVPVNEKTNQPHILLPVYEPFYSRYERSMLWAFLILPVSCFIWWLMIAWRDIDKEAWQRYEARLYEKKNKDLVTFRGYI